MAAFYITLCESPPGLGSNITHQQNRIKFFVKQSILRKGGILLS